ncbi:MULTISPECIES: methylamine utilization protein MauJ [unclassified Phyllobacterium]|uniref:methylamine utilization protein MauJ n=1 Tax=unclassified Phyllobacterium TaxID=2638441 RepID=UPI003012FFCB
MRCVANFEVASDMSVEADNHVLNINDPHGRFKARIKNIPRSEFTTPFLISIHIYFDVDDLATAKDVADDLLVSCLNMLAFTTGARYRKHRIRQIVDVSDPVPLAMRYVLMWSDTIKYEDPEPYLRTEIATSIERLLEFNIPPAIQRALRWYRLGIDASSPDDQFTYFWFALEIVAEFQKTNAKVPDACPHCRSALYCEQCGKHPEHKPYPKQAIRALMKAADSECDDLTVDLLDQTRNSLMHGSTLREIDASLPAPHESVVDILGRILWNALVKQFPDENIAAAPELCRPERFVNYKLDAIVHLQTIVPVDQEGNFVLEFAGFQAAQKPFGPPQSALPFGVRMTLEHYDQLLKLGYSKSDHQAMLQRIVQRRIQEQNGFIDVLVLATDMTLVQQALERKEEGAWQDVFRDIFKPTDLTGNEH